MVFVPRTVGGTVFFWGTGTGVYSVPRPPFVALNLRRKNIRPPLYKAPDEGSTGPRVPPSICWSVSLRRRIVCHNQPNPVQFLFYPIGRGISLKVSIIRHPAVILLSFGTRDRAPNPLHSVMWSPLFARDVSTSRGPSGETRTGTSHFLAHPVQKKGAKNFIIVN